VPFVDANGQRLFYEERGTGDPLVMVMGLGADHLAWALNVPALSERFRTIAFDNRDVGQSSTADRDYDVPDLAADTLALADALSLESFHLLGLSLGGAVSQHVALAAPERVRTLTLAATWAGTARPYAIARALSWEPMVTRFDSVEFVEAMMQLTLSERLYERPGGPERALQILLANPHPQSPEAFARQVRAGATHDVRNRLAELRMPVHVICAEHDILIPPWKQRELRELIPGAQMTTIARAPHAVHAEHAEEFNAAVLDFLASA
jgi:3-oxoadipate enol-lactonase